MEMYMDVDTGTTAFMLCCIIGLTMMIPGLALFYGDMVSVKSSTNMMMMTFGAVAVVGVLWVLFGFSMVFGTSYGGFVGSFTEFAGMKDLLESQTTINGLPVSLFALFQALFAAITVALVSGAAADRMKFGAWMTFATAWAILVYFPVAHWVFAFDGVVTPDATGGWIANKLKAIDFAGGTAVHINSGAAALAVAIVLGKRKGWPGTPMRPHNLPFVMLGAGLLWFGWYGFNAGSAVGSNGIAGATFITTTVATAAAMLAWLLTEKIRDGHATSLGAASGIVAGLVAITPSCSSVTPVGAILVGAIAGVLCALAVALKYKFGYDDSLDVVGVHLVGGLVGTILIGFFSNLDEGTTWAPDGALNGVLYGGGWTQLASQTIGALVALAYSFVLTIIIGLVLKYTIGLRVSEDVELTGIDLASHGETAYEEAK